MQDFDAAHTFAAKAPLAAVGDRDPTRDEEILNHAAA
jgi:hypothetical protein